MTEIEKLKDWIRRALGNDCGNPPGLYVLGVKAGFADNFSPEEREAIEAAELLMREGEELVK